MSTETLFRYLLRLGDTSLVLGQRLGEWIGHALFTGIILFGMLFFGSLGLTLLTHWLKNRTK